MKTCIASPEDPHASVRRDLQRLRMRVGELRDAVGTAQSDCSGRSGGSIGLEQAAATKREIDRLEALLLEE